jgi:hypothetical protein
MFGTDFFDPYQYLAPRDESATLKNVPIEFRDHPVIRFLISENVGGRVRYPTNYDNRFGAECFSVYLG